MDSQEAGAGPKQAPGLVLGLRSRAEGKLRAGLRGSGSLRPIQAVWGQAREIEEGAGQPSRENEEACLGQASEDSSWARRDKSIPN